MAQRMPNVQNHRREFIKNTIAIGSAIGLAGCIGDDDDFVDFGIEEDTEYEEVEPVSWLTLSREDNPDYFEEAQQSHSMLADLGFSFDETVQESGAWVDTLFDKDYDCATIGWSNTVERLFPYYNLYFSFHSQFAGEGGGNFSEWTSEEYDETVEAFASEMDLEDRQEMAFQCQEILAKNVPVIYTTHPATLNAHNTDLFTGWEKMIGGFPYFNPISLRTAEGDPDTVVYGTVSPPEQYPNFMGHTGPQAVFLHKLNYDPLVQMDTDGNPVAEGAAEDWEVVDDTTIDVTLRDGMTWHDGEPVTVEDVKFTWDYAVEHGIPYLAADIAPYESSEILDDRTVRFNLETPFGGFISVSMYRLPILPEHVWDGITEEEGLDHPSQWGDPDMTGCGPFQMVSYDPGNRIRFEKFEDHYAADEYDFDTLIYDIYGTNTTVVGDLIGGEVTFASDLGVTDWERADDEDHVDAEATGTIQANGIFINTDNEPFNDVLVRQAMAYAIDSQLILDTVHQGMGEIARSPVTPDNETYHNPDVEAYERNMEQARDLLVEAGLGAEDGTLMKPVDWEPTVEYVGLDE